jgi:GrpB-like predicted nucleotidyltransferase (UPF0157 family)
MSKHQPPVKPYEFTRYDDPAAADEPWDPRYPEVARHIADLIQPALPAAEIEHIGSTAIPNCTGKGVVDMMVIYPGRIEEAREVVEDLGFQPFVSSDPFPPQRPVYIGTIRHAGDTFRSHVHLMPPGWPEIETQRRFRDRLRVEPKLVAEYVALKRAVLAAGISSNVEYNDGKGAFINDVIAGRR